MKQLCRKIRLPEDVTGIILRCHNDSNFTPNLHKLTQERTWTEGRQELKATLGDDPDGFKELCCQLHCALNAKAEYDRLDIPEGVYYDTMGCFSRFVREHMESYGRYGFDRGFWTVRQISCKLFRIGQLEYELITQDGKPTISLHIPTDVTLRTPLLRQSYLDAWTLLNRTFPEYADAPVYCHSWLLSPTLSQLLPQDSNILKFQRFFRITPLDTPSTGVLQWVFKNPHLPVEQFPENTSLQRKLKAYLLDGGTFVDGKGYLSGEPFL